MQCEYVTLKDGRQVHYRRAGSGPAMILLHPSPQCSEAIIPATTAFSELCECFALDTPGYGLSDDIPATDPDMGHYADSVIATADALGMDSFYLYGAATGSQVAIEIGKRYPDRIKLMMLDSNGHVSDAERERVLDGYFPDVAPRRDGGHLLTYWDMCRHLFVTFPWQSDRVEDRLGIPLPPVEVTQTMLLRYLRAGTCYQKAYRPAFETEQRAHMDGLDVPSTMMRWEGSIALAITDALIDLGVPDCMQVLHAGPTLEERFSVQVAALKSAIAEYGDTGLLRPQNNSMASGTFERRYFQVGDHQLHGQVNLAGQGTPAIFLHDALQSSDQMMEHAAPYAGNRPIMLLDLPGHGASQNADGNTRSSIVSLANCIAPAISEFTDGPVDIVGAGMGGAVGAELANHVAINQLKLIDPIPFTSAEKEAFAEQGLADISPKSDGSHLVSAWAMVVDNEFFWPWFDKSPAAARSHNVNLSPEYLHQKVASLFRVGSLYRDIALLEAGLDWAALLNSLEVPVDIICTERNPCPERVEALRV